jgi:3-phenylpropionate/cinnamic acid dioxygenase small subunit
MKTRLTLGLAAGLCLLQFASLAQASDADVIREAKDRADIEVLIWNYTKALDTLDEDKYPTFFTEDGTFCCEHDLTYKGRAELKTIIQEVKKNRAAQEAKGETPPKMYHIISNSHIEFVDKDHAHIDSYWMTAFADKPPNGSPRMALIGRCVDEVVRVNGKWLIKTRDVFPK